MRTAGMDWSSRLTTMDANQAAAAAGKVMDQRCPITIYATLEPCA
jgi:hypothetical protein